MAQVQAEGFEKYITHNLSLSGKVQYTHDLKNRRKLLRCEECMLIYLSDSITLHHMISAVKEFGTTMRGRNLPHLNTHHVQQAKSNKRQNAIIQMKKGSSHLISKCMQLEPDHPIIPSVNQR